MIVSGWAPGGEAQNTNLPEEQKIPAGDAQSLQVLDLSLATGIAASPKLYTCPSNGAAGRKEPKKLPMCKL